MARKYARPTYTRTVAEYYNHWIDLKRVEELVRSDNRLVFYMYSGNKTTIEYETSEEAVKAFYNFKGALE